MKRMTALLLALAMAFTLAACTGQETAPSNPPADNTQGAQENTAPAAPGETYTLQVGTVVDENTCVGKTLVAINEELKERTDGRLELEFFWLSTLGGTTELCEGVSMGTVDIGILNSAVLSNYVQAIDILNYPYVFQSREQIQKAIDLYFDDITEGLDETLGIPLGIWELGWRELLNTKRTISTLEDFAGLTIRVQEGKTYYDTFNALGCIPTEVAVSELVTAMQQGVVDAHENPLATPVNQHHYEFAKHLTMTNHMWGNSLPVLSRTAAERLPEDLRSTLYEVFDEYRYYSLEVGVELEQQFLQTMIDNGVEVTYLSDEEMGRVIDATKATWGNYYNQDLLNNIVALAD